jgi:hypothetical protein
MPKRKQPPQQPTQEKAELVVPAPVQPALFRVLDAVRAAVNAVLDLADAAAEALARRI